MLEKKQNIEICWSSKWSQLRRCRDTSHGAVVLFQYLSVDLHWLALLKNIPKLLMYEISVCLRCSPYTGVLTSCVPKRWSLRFSKHALCLSESQHLPASSFSSLQNPEPAPSRPPVRRRSLAIPCDAWAINDQAPHQRNVVLCLLTIQGLEGFRDRVCKPQGRRPGSGRQESPL
jgi:hypothetical protein